MITTETLFGLPKSDIQKTCILTPFLSKGLLAQLNIERLYRGSPFSSASNDDYTLIHTQIGPTFVGDCVLYLNNTPCEQILFLGACGAVTKTDEYDIGKVVVAKESLSYESFSMLIEETYQEPLVHQANSQLLEKFQRKNVSTVKNASFGSFRLESDYLDELDKREVNTIEMEVSALYAAALKMNKPALALLYITDIINEKHVFEPMNPEQQKKVADAQATSINHLLNFINSK